MRSSTIARNYAETLLELANRNGGLATAQAFAAALDELAALVEREPRIRAFLETLATTQRLSTSSQQQARAALQLLYEQALGIVEHPIRCHRCHLAAGLRVADVTFTRWDVRTGKAQAPCKLWPPTHGSHAFCYLGLDGRI